MRLAGLLLVLSLAASSFAQMIDMRVRVVDDKNRPVAGVRVSSNWSFTDGVWKARNEALTDKQGRATGTWNVPSYGALIVAWDKKDARCAVVQTLPTKQEVTFRLQPVAHIKYAVSSLPENKPLAANGMILGAEGYAIGFADPLVASPWIPVPSGKGSAYLSALNYEARRFHYDLKPGERRDLGSVPLDYTAGKKAEGKPAPEFVYEDQKNLPHNFKLSDWKGSWVLLEFWGFWCDPCIRRGIPSAIVLHDLAARDGLPIKVLGIHELDASTVAEVEAKLPGIKQQFWGGRDLPFAWVVDADQSIAKSLGVSGYPTTILIDPEGIVVGERRESALANSIHALSPDHRAEWLLAEPSPFWFRNCSINGLIDPYFWGLPTEPTPDAKVILEKIGGVKFGTFSCDGAIGSVLNLLFEGTGLTWRIEGGKLIVERGVDSSWRAPFAASREQSIVGLLSTRPELQFSGTLADLTEYLAGRVEPYFVMLPQDVFAGRINPDRKVTFKTRGGTLWDELTALLEPLGMRLTVRHEMVVIEAIRR